MKRILATLCFALTLAACGGSPAAQPTTSVSTPLTNPQTTSGTVATPGSEQTAVVGTTTGSDATAVSGTATGATAGTTGTTTSETAGPTQPIPAQGSSGTAVVPTAASGSGSAGTPVAGTATGEGDLLQVAESDSRFTILAEILRASGIDQSLNNGQPYTLFAPTNEAFTALPADVLTALRQNPELLRSILLYHVAQGRILSADITAPTSAQTVGGEPLEITVQDGIVRVNNQAQVIAPDVQAGNGVIHGIDRVLLPPGVNLPSGQ